MNREKVHIANDIVRISFEIVRFQNFVIEKVFSKFFWVKFKAVHFVLKGPREWPMTIFICSHFVILRFFILTPSIFSGSCHDPYEYMIDAVY